MSLSLSNLEGGTLGHGKPRKQNLVVDLVIGGSLGKAKWLFVMDMGGNLVDLGHRSCWWAWGGANGQGQVVFES